MFSGCKIRLSLLESRLLPYLIRRNFRADKFSRTCKKLQKFSTNFRTISRKLSFWYANHERFKIGRRVEAFGV